MRITLRNSTAMWAGWARFVGQRPVIVVREGRTLLIRGNPPFLLIAFGLARPFVHGERDFAFCMQLLEIMDGDVVSFSKIDQADRAIRQTSLFLWRLPRRSTHLLAGQGTDLL